MMGIVKFFNSTKGFGFISPEGGGADLFVHATAAEHAGMPNLTEGQRVSFDIETDAKGAKAVNLGSVPLDETAHPPPGWDPTVWGDPGNHHLSQPRL
jgi:CspA family cold shock protein